MLQKHLFYTWSRSRYIPLRYGTSFSYHVQQFPSTSINPKKMQENDHFCTGGVTTLHVTRASIWTTYYTLGQSLLYRMAFTSWLLDKCKTGVFEAFQGRKADVENEIMDFSILLSFTPPITTLSRTYFIWNFIYSESSVFSHQYPPKSFALGQLVNSESNHLWLGVALT